MLRPKQNQIIFPQSDPIPVDIHIVSPDAPTVIILPAIGVNIIKYEKLVSGLIQQGLNTISADYPGCGRNTPKVSRSFNYNYADLLRHFIPQLVQIAKEINPQIPVLLGHSLGGHLATLYAASHQVKVIGIATGNIGLKYWDIKGKFKILQAVGAFNLLMQLYGYLPGHKVGFGNREAKGLMQDWCKTVLTGKYNHIIKPQPCSSQPALFIQLQGDEWAPISSLTALSENFVHPEIRQIDLRKIIKGNQHSIWVKQPEPIIRIIHEWLA